MDEEKPHTENSPPKMLQKFLDGMDENDTLSVDEKAKRKGNGALGVPYDALSDGAD